jgi:hypothetical protein
MSKDVKADGNIIDISRNGIVNITHTLPPFIGISQAFGTWLFRYHAVNSAL